MSEELGYSFRCASLKVAENNPRGTGSQYSPCTVGAFTKKKKKKQILPFVQDDMRGQEDREEAGGWFWIVLIVRGQLFVVFTCPAFGTGGVFLFLSYQ